MNKQNETINLIETVNWQASLKEKHPRDEYENAPKDNIPTEEDKIALIFGTACRDRYCKEAHMRWAAYTYKEARKDYSRIRKQLIADGTWKKRISNAVKAQTENQTSTPISSGNATEKVKQQECGNTVVTDKINEWLDNILAQTNAILKQKGAISAIKHLRDATGYSLLAAKLQVDMLADPSMAEPIALFHERTALIKKKVAERGASFNEQVQDMRKQQIKKEFDKDKARALKQEKIDISGDNKAGLLQIARRIARELAANGPITVDDVTEKMAEQYNVLPSKGNKRHNWKGAIFTKSEWQYICEVASRQVLAHSRSVGLWALKSWLKKNTLNGKRTNVSAFVMTQLYNDFKKRFNNVDLSKCTCFIGEEQLAQEIRENILNSGNKLYEVPVNWMPGAVGAIITLPKPETRIEQTK